MKGNVEKSLADYLSTEVDGVDFFSPEYASEELPDTGTSVVVLVEIEHRGGGCSLAEVTLRVSSVIGGVSVDAHREVEAEVITAAGAVAGLDCGDGVELCGVPYFVGQGGGVDGNRWVSEIRYRYGVLWQV